jgi:hypothetical protein
MLEMREVQTTASKLGLAVVLLEIQRREQITLAFTTLRNHADALYVCSDPLVDAKPTPQKIIMVFKASISTWFPGKVNDSNFAIAVVCDLQGSPIVGSALGSKGSPEIGELGTSNYGQCQHRVLAPAT